MSDLGFIALSRGVIEHPVVGAEKPFSDFAAWIWLLLHAGWKERRVRVSNGRAADVVALDRGQLTYSQSYLSTAWVWSGKRVRTFLNRLEKHGQIAVQTDSLQTIITICNYEHYQNPLPRKDGQMDGQTDVQGARKGRKEEEGNKERKNTARRNALEPAGFGEWYALYPRKVARHQAAAAFRKMVPAEISAEALIERTKLFAEKWVHPNVDLRYCPYPATWLSQRRFLDAQMELAAPDGQAPIDVLLQQQRPEDFTRHQWRDALALLAEGHAWARCHWGPAPGERGCLVPRDLLISAGFELCD